MVLPVVLRRGGVFKKARTDDPTPPTRRGEATNDPDDYTVIVSGAALSPGHFIRQSKKANSVSPRAADSYKRLYIFARAPRESRRELK